MILRIAQKAVDLVLTQSEIAQEDKELYVYGFFVLFSNLFFFLLTLFFGFILCIPLESAVFYIMFAAVRGFAGGIHAKSEGLCTLSTSLALFVSLLAVKGLAAAEKPGYVPVMLTVGLVCVAACSPVDTEEKRLTESERKRYKCKSIIAASAIAVIAAVAHVIGESSISAACAVSLVLESALLTFGKMQTGGKSTDH